MSKMKILPSPQPNFAPPSLRPTIAPQGQANKHPPSEFLALAFSPLGWTPRSFERATETKPKDERAGAQKSVLYCSTTEERERVFRIASCTFTKFAHWHSTAQHSMWSGTFSFLPSEQKSFQFENRVGEFLIQTPH